MRKTKLLKNFSELVGPKDDQLLGFVDACHCCFAIKQHLGMKQLQQILNKMNKERKQKT